MFLRKAHKVDINRFTDHLGISFELCTCEKSRGASYWKLNDTLLQQKTFCTNFKLSYTKKLKSCNYVFVDTKFVMYDDNDDYVIMIM